VDGNIIHQRLWDTQSLWKCSDTEIGPNNLKQINWNKYRYRITEWCRLEWTSGGHLVRLPCSGRAT